ncbi:hypothetical protein TGAM01_v201475 [Trichoderma gamsii]|uniref:Zn(2)-C6 fungal-type domain-containing protein n=2 Tax=Trichoderma gamsii TaxID=398673 RepID=A0A2P5A0P6_9HYPO|nr:hypothetical protein TGAM01_v201475 [Trichoderma gamsii]PON30108.1 hypothetical protein TGAM01_v201475 [Trichoderma gamsii]
MVGIPGKSKACRDCKRRRVKCDLTLPSCMRCIKAGIVCKGYEQAMLWINSTPDHPNVTAISAITDAQLHQRQQCSPSSEWARLLHQLRAQLSQPNYDTSYFRSQALRILQGIYLPQPHTATCDEIGDDPTPSSWIRAVCQMQAPSSTLDHSLLAFCAVQVNLSGDSCLSQDETGQVYNHALSKLIEDLDSRQPSSDEMLAAIVALSTCELFVFPTDSSWSAHAQGISELLRNRGVPEQATANWRSLCVIQGLGQRRSLGLEADRWRRLIGPSGADDSFVRMMHIIVDVPSMLQEAHAILLSGNNPLAASQHSARLIQKFEELDSWRQFRQRSVAPDPLYWTVMSKMNHPADEGYADKLFPFALMFSSMGSAIQWIFCSTVMLHVIEAAFLLEALEFTTPNGTGSISPSPSDNSSSMLAEADGLARMLCQSIEFCYRNDNGLFGAQATCSTQWTLRRYFRRRGLARELEWCKRIKNIRGLASRCGIDLMQFGPDW